MVSKTANKSIFRWYDPFISRVGIPILSLIVRLLMFSCRLIRVEGRERAEEALARAGGKAVYATWHQRIPLHMLTLLHLDLTTMVSQSRDGEFAARLLYTIGLKGVRGSSTRGGSNALKELTQKIKEGTSGGMVVDGPLGPARVAKIGAVVMARNAQVPLVPLTWGVDRCWVINSWDRLIIPKPFARAVYLYEEPIWVPASADSEELERYRRLLEDKLNQGTSWCDEQLGEERPWRKVKDVGTPEIGPLPKK
ncbi:MAG: lysophospholipid acyltransferase family protein [Deltaproteobacteria bacterium]|nr:lysophospholipid acyltransferase family protein [Deltaproteobacteria bacterium]